MQVTPVWRSELVSTTWRGTRSVHLPTVHGRSDSLEPENQPVLPASRPETGISACLSERYGPWRRDRAPALRTASRHTEPTAIPRPRGHGICPCPALARRLAPLRAETWLLSPKRSGAGPPQSSRFQCVLRQRAGELVRPPGEGPCSFSGFRGTAGSDRPRVERGYLPRRNTPVLCQSTSFRCRATA